MGDIRDRNGHWFTINRNSTKYFHTTSNNKGNKLMGRETEATNINVFKRNLGMCQEKEDIERQRGRGEAGF